MMKQKAGVGGGDICVFCGCIANLFVLLSDNCSLVLAVHGLPGSGVSQTRPPQMEWSLRADDI